MHKIDMSEISRLIIVFINLKKKEIKEYSKEKQWSFVKGLHSAMTFG